MHSAGLNGYSVTGNGSRVAKLNWTGPPHNREIHFSPWLTGPLTPAQVGSAKARGKKGRKANGRSSVSARFGPETVRIGLAIRRFRVESDLTQVDFARRLRWDESVVSRVEHGHGLTRERLRTLKEVFRLSLGPLPPARDNRGPLAAIQKRRPKRPRKLRRQQWTGDRINIRKRPRRAD